MKKQKGKLKVGTIISWILYALLVGGVVAIVVYWKSIFGVSHVDPLTKAVVWDYEPFFHNKVSDNTFVQSLFTDVIPAALKIVVIVGVAITIGILLHYLGKVRKVGSQKTTTVFILIVNFLK